MLSGARGVSISNSKFNNVGRDLTINNYNVHCQPDSETEQVPLSKNTIP